MKTTVTRTVLVAAWLAAAFGLLGCGTTSGNSGGSSGLFSSGDREARNAALAELQRHFVKGSDGWTTAVTTGNAYASDHFLRQYKDLEIVSVEANELTESDKLNGFEWAGQATFKHTVCREAGGFPTYVLDGMAEGHQAYAEKAPGRWSQWVEYTPGPLHFQKQKGRWLFQWDGTYLRGQRPGTGDFASAGIR